jgi:hypothetical protein
VPGFPIKLINYMAARKPCVLFASSAGHLKHRHHALLAAEDTGAALGEQIVEALRDPELRELMAYNGYCFVKENHDRRRVAAQVCEAYARALGIAVTVPVPSVQAQPAAAVVPAGHTRHGHRTRAVRELTLSKED